MVEERAEDIFLCKGFQQFHLGAQGPRCSSLLCRCVVRREEPTLTFSSEEEVS